MKFKIPMEGGDDEINMAPMIDMVFLLLIFFMVASKLAQMERVPVELPVADKSKVPDETPHRQMISILPAKEGADQAQIFMNLETIDNLEDFATKIGAMYAANENMKVYMRADKDVKYKHIKQIMDACSGVGIADVVFGTFESGN